MRALLDSEPVELRWGRERRRQLDRKLWGMDGLRSNLDYVGSIGAGHYSSKEGTGRFWHDKHNPNHSPYANLWMHVNIGPESDQG